MIVPKLDRELGIEIYATKSPGIGGKIRHFPEDFIVEEVLLDGSKASIEPKQIARPTGLGPYLICGLVKRKWDTLLAVRAVAEQLDANPERIQIGGIKDANALTAQNISISRITPELISGVKIKDIRVYPVRFSKDKMKPSLLYGNQFQITIRSIKNANDEISHRSQSVKKDFEILGGVPNFFGHQRFGTTRPITHIVGKHIVQGRWEDAALTFLGKSSEYEHPKSRQARQQLMKTGDFRGALKYFPSQLKYETIMLSHLAKHPKDFVNAFRRLPKKLCKLFVQSYQSFLFNKFLSRRIKLGIPINKPQNGELTKNSRLLLPLLGFKQSYSSGAQGEIEREILEKEKVVLDQFRVALMPQISAPGEMRITLVPIEELCLGEVKTDSINESNRMITLSFTLGKGSYATLVLREFMKPRNPVNAGF